MQGPFANEQPIKESPTQDRHRLKPERSRERKRHSDGSDITQQLDDERNANKNGIVEECIRSMAIQTLLSD
ncbi:hypothetical protein [Yersinia enterocolitica]|uniref:hypothetical protein n=1 Tax=unclassified Yersinia (in: enterobacteria) TaxID=2653513 RepID=UPI000FDA5FFB